MAPAAAQSTEVVTARRHFAVAPGRRGAHGGWSLMAPAAAQSPGVVTARRRFAVAAGRRGAHGG
jgi:hypothetical protein